MSGAHAPPSNGSSLKRLDPSRLGVKPVLLIPHQMPSFVVPSPVSSYTSIGPVTLSSPVHPQRPVLRAVDAAHLHMREVAVNVTAQVATVRNSDSEQRSFFPVPVVPNVAARPTRYTPGVAGSVLEAGSSPFYPLQGDRGEGVPTSIMQPTAWHAFSPHPEVHPLMHSHMHTHAHPQARMRPMPRPSTAHYALSSSHSHSHSQSDYGTSGHDTRQRGRRQRQRSGGQRRQKRPSSSRSRSSRSRKQEVPMPNPRDEVLPQSHILSASTKSSAVVPRSTIDFLHNELTDARDQYETLGDDVRVPTTGMSFTTQMELPDKLLDPEATVALRDVQVYTPVHIHKLAMMHVEAQKLYDAMQLSSERALCELVGLVLERDDGLNCRQRRRLMNSSAGANSRSNARRVRRSLPYTAQLRIGALGTRMHDFSGNHTLPCFFKLQFDGFRKFLLRHSSIFHFEGKELAPEQTVRLTRPDWRKLLTNIDDTPFILINISRRELMRQCRLKASEEGEQAPAEQGSTSST